MLQRQLGETDATTVRRFRFKASCTRTARLVSDQASRLDNKD